MLLNLLVIIIYYYKYIVKALSDQPFEVGIGVKAVQVVCHRVVAEDVLLWRTEEERSATLTS